MKKGSGIACSEGFLKFMARIREEYQIKFILFSLLNFDY